MTSEGITRLALFTLAVGVLQAACGPRESERPQAATWTLTPVATIGGEEEGPASFSDIRGVAVDGQGRVYILDGQEQEVRLFDAGGALVRRIGRNGDGPGEFRGANGVAVDRYDRLWVYDPRARRVSVFDSAGGLAATHALTIQSYGYVWDGGVDAEGRIYDRQGVRIDTLWTPFIRRTDLARMTADTLALPACEAATLPSYTFRSGRSSGVIGVPFAPSQYVRYDPRGRAWCADTRTVAIAQYRLGDSVPYRTLTVSADPAPVTPSERDSAIAEVRKFGAGIGPGDPDFTLIPATKPILLAIDPDDEGRLWVRATTSEGARLFVFDSAGKHIAVVPFIAGVSPWLPLIVRRGRLYAVATDSLDVPVVRMFRVGTAAR
jgi:hypothetical protein